MIFQFRQQFGMNIHDAKLPAQSNYESFEERLHNGVIEAENLAHVVSLEEERQQIASKPEPPTQMGMHLESTLRLQRKKRYISRTDPESLRTKYRVMTNLWLLAQLRQPGRRLHADLTKDTFKDFLEEILATDSFILKGQIEGETRAAPIWTHFMDNEFQLRRDAMKPCREQGYSIQAAPWATYRNQEHRRKHWVTLPSIANSRRDTISDKAAREIEQLKKHVAQLQKARSTRSPRRAKGSGKMFEVNWLYKILRHSLRTKEKEVEAKVKKITKAAAAKERVSTLVRLLNSSTKLVTSTTRRSLDSVFPFPSGSCTKQNCRQHHNCAGCDKVGVPYNDCLCLAHL